MLIHRISYIIGLLLAFSGIIRDSEAINIDENQLIIARCRVQCLKMFLPENISKIDAKCDSSRNCSVCWDMCSNLNYNKNLWDYLCEPNNDCGSGCKMVCNFNTDSKSNRRKTGRFFDQPSAKDFGTYVQIKWNKPKKISGQSPETYGHLIYILLSRKRHQPGGWKIFQQTAGVSITIDSESLPSVPGYGLLAVNDQGLVAEVKFPSRYQSRVGELQMGPIQRKTSNSAAAPKNSRKKPNLQVEHKIIEHDQKLSIHLQLQLNVQNTSNVRIPEYCVHWFLISCNAYEDTKYCDIPEQHYGPKQFPTNVKTPELNLTDIMYNSEYTIRIESDRKSPKDINIVTPKCMSPDVTRTYCEDRINRWTGGGVTWNLNNASLVYNFTIGKVMANISWLAPFNKPNVQYSVSWQGPEVSETLDRIVAGKVVTPLDYVVLKLDIGFVYRIRVKAFYRTEQGSNETLDSEFIYLNLTRGSYSLEDGENGRKTLDDFLENTNSGPKKVSSAAILAACAGILVLMAVLLLLIYKKRKSLKEVVIIKTMAAKNNTYKSNVTGSSKMDYTSEPTVVTDEWELDPSLLQFSTPLGQGAFGKVVTGYYAQRKVAIKVVKDSAPLSYKEDLLDELNLMKRIGIHPNIVSMVGACTLKEPIALVMEYVPYGNLHNFLRKCRSEGEVRQRNGSSELNYSVMDKNGQIENGIITPVDILSFARQISMAMEYMAENKYVHRDLAARNVLLDCGKVVKVCDFGLSRDIYKDNQYQKLTNGKLPIKWMAIESLRDRIFTTQSDVWSFGILLWEIVSLGASPYPSIALADLYHVLCSGYRMEKTSNCSEELYRIMRLCWAENPHKRPTFTQLRNLLEYLLSKDCNYLELDNINVPLAASENSSPPQSFEMFTDLAPPLPERRQIHETTTTTAAAVTTTTSTTTTTPTTPTTTPTTDASPEELSTEFLIRRVYSQ